MGSFRASDLPPLASQAKKISSPEGTGLLAGPAPFELQPAAMKVNFGSHAQLVTHFQVFELRCELGT